MTEGEITAVWQNNSCYVRQHKNLLNQTKKFETMSTPTNGED
jgi:hypothetical protein